MNDKEYLLTLAREHIEKIRTLQKSIALLNSQLLKERQLYSTLLSEYIQFYPEEFTLIKQTPRSNCEFPFFENKVRF